MRKFLWAVALALWIGFIWFNSTLSAETSSSASLYLTRFIKTVMDNLPIDYEFNVHSLAELHHLVRKAAHFVEFAVLGLFLCCALQAWRLKSRLGFGFIWWAAVAVATADEFIQLSAPGRSGQITDIMLDFGGALVGWAVYEFFSWAKR